ncbi:MAG: LysM peptidoglycan-binding domain-containing protein, partial [Treponema sp.]|nr:LysM peptidoglycan-binding domain-containing protein [Treponema sp.]
MKNLAKLFGITALVTVIGFTALLAGACGSTPPEAPPPSPAPAAPPPPPPPPPPTPAITQEYHDAYTRHHNDIILDRAQRYTVQREDTLVSIARRFYQDGSLYPLIFAASDEVADPDIIAVGVTLIIPELAVNLNDERARKSLFTLILEMADIEEHRGRNETAVMLRNH